MVGFTGVKLREATAEGTAEGSSCESSLGHSSPGRNPGLPTHCITGPVEFHIWCDTSWQLPLGAPPAGSRGRRPTGPRHTVVTRIVPGPVALSRCWTLFPAPFRGVAFRAEKTASRDGRRISDIDRSICPRSSHSGPHPGPPSWLPIRGARDGATGRDERISCSSPSTARACVRPKRNRRNPVGFNPGPCHLRAGSV